MKMKKIMSAAASAVLGLNLLAMPVSNASAAYDGEILVLGDSIASGYGLSDSEYKYSDILADYYNCYVKNLAVSGADTDDLLAFLETSQADEAVSGADTIVISIGGNDLIHYASQQIIKFAAGKGYLNSGYTLADIPDEPTINDVRNMVKLYDENGGTTNDCLLNYLKQSKNLMSAATLISSINSGLCTSGTGLIDAEIIPNIKAACDAVRSINSDAEIIIQTVYNPLQLEYDYYSSVFGANAPYASFSTAFTSLRTSFVDIMNAFRDDVLALDGIKAADVYYEFTALDDINTSKVTKTQGSAYYFTNMQVPLASGVSKGLLASMDFHPNQAGHLAIAAELIDVIGEKGNGNGLLSKVYSSLDNKESYPAIPLETYKNALGSDETSLGDVNGDGAVNPVDATLILQQYTSSAAGSGDIFTDAQKKSADVNKDSTINPVDATSVLNFYTRKAAGENISPDEFFN